MIFFTVQLLTGWNSNRFFFDYILALKKIINADKPFS
jgi:hypothetical protein